MRKIFDGLYNICGTIAAYLIGAICLLVTSQVILNIITKIGGSSFSMTIPSYADFAGYFLAASSFLALAYTFNKGGHIRVTLLLSFIGDKSLRFLSELFSLALCAACSVFASYYMILLVIESYEFDDKSSGIIAVPIWIPQLPVAVGLTVLSIAIIDVLLQTISRKSIVIVNTEQE